MKYEKNLLSVSLSASYISAVADRFGLWGIPNAPGVAWGNYEIFLSYTKHLIFWMPDSSVFTIGTIATALEVIIAIWLITGLKRRYAALSSAALLSLFAISMILADGLKGPLDYSVFTAATASLLLASLEMKKS